MSVKETVTVAMNVLTVSTSLVATDVNVKLVRLTVFCVLNQPSKVKQNACHSLLFAH